MPRSTAHRTGYCEAASPKGQLSATTAVRGALVLGVGREPVGGQGVGDGVHGGAQRALAVPGRHLPGQGTAVLLAHPLGHALGGQRSEQLERLLEQEDQQVVAASEQVEGRVVADGPEPLGGPSRLRCRPTSPW